MRTIYEKLCTLEGCNNPHKAKGYCSPHYSRWKTTGYPGPVDTKVSECTLEDCDGILYSLGYCRTHYRRARNHEGNPFGGNTLRGEGKWKSKGYAVLRRPGHPNANTLGNIREHVYVMSEFLGRPLIPGENVHHKNGVKDDNRLENLELWVSHQPSGQRPEDLLQWAYEIIERYGSKGHDSEP
jgi:hypothetical protein